MAAKTSLPATLKLKLPIVQDDYDRVRRLEKTTHLSEEEARFILTVYDDVTRPCSGPQARSFVAVMVGRYPKSQTDDPEAYADGVVSIIVSMPPDLAHEVVDHLTLTCKFLPTRAEVYEAAKLFVTKRFALLYRARYALRQLEENREAEEHARIVARDKAERASWGNEQWRAFYVAHNLPVPAHLQEEAPPPSPGEGSARRETGRAPTGGAQPVASTLDGVIEAVVAGRPSGEAEPAPKAARRGKAR